VIFLNKGFLILSEILFLSSKKRKNEFIFGIDIHQNESIIEMTKFYEVFL